MYIEEFVWEKYLQWFLFLIIKFGNFRIAQITETVILLKNGKNKLDSITLTPTYYS